MNPFAVATVSALAAVDLLLRNPGRISANYTVSDVTHSPTAKERGITEQNRLPFSAKVNAKRLAKLVIEPANKFTGHRARVSSWWRSERLNSILPGASPTSVHKTGRAADLELVYQDETGQMVENNALLMRALLAGGQFDRVLIYGAMRSPRFLHVEVPEPGKKPRQLVRWRTDNTWKNIDLEEARLFFG